MKDFVTGCVCFLPGLLIVDHFPHFGALVCFAGGLVAAHLKK